MSRLQPSVQAEWPTGWLTGHAIRTARKAGPCEYWCGSEHGYCANGINVGDRYVVGEVDPDKAGGYGVKRYCLACAERTSGAQ